MFFTKKKQRGIDNEFIRLQKLVSSIGDAFEKSGIAGAVHVDNYSSSFRTYRLKDLDSIDKKVDLLLDHLGLEYKSKTTCGPTLKEKESE